MARLHRVADARPQALGDVLACDRRFAIVAFAIFPIVWTFLVSLKPEEDIVTATMSTSRGA